MVVSLADYHVLVSIHRPLGLAILILVIVRFVVRRLVRFRRSRRRCRAWSVWRPRHRIHTIRLDVRACRCRLGMRRRTVPDCHLGIVAPAIYFAACALLYAVLRKTHTVLAYLLFATIVAHFGAIRFHTLIMRDGILLWMCRGTSGRATYRTTEEKCYDQASKEHDLPLV